jgi:hypothetical protein
VIQCAHRRDQPGRNNAFMSERSTEPNRDDDRDATDTAPETERPTDPDPIEEIEDQERKGWLDEPTTS